MGLDRNGKPYAYTREYQETKNIIDFDVKIILERYLRSGNASLLLKAQNHLVNLSQRKVEWLPEEVNNNNQNSISCATPCKINSYQLNMLIL